MLLVQNLLHGQQLDDSTGSLMKCRAFALGVGGDAEGDEEAALAVLALHDGFELVDVRAADAVHLLDLDGEVSPRRTCDRSRSTSAWAATLGTRKRRDHRTRAPR